MMQDFKTFYKQHLVKESFKQDLAMMALATSLAITTGIGLHKIGFLKDKDSIDDALRNAQSKGYNVQQIIQQSKQPEIQQKAKEILQQKQDDKAEQMHKKAIEPQKPSASKPNKELEAEFHKAAMNYIKNNELEGSSINYRRPYKDHKGYPTIGVGHLITSKEQRSGIFNKGISEEGVLKLFIKDIKSKLDTAHRLFPKYDAYPLDLRIKLLDGIFRGDVSGSPGTIKLINAGKWEKAANEFLDNKEYKEAVKKGYGTGPRMKKIADAIRSMANKQQPQATKPKMQPETTPFF